MALLAGNYVFFTADSQIWITYRGLDGLYDRAYRETTPALPGDAGKQAISQHGTDQLAHFAIVPDGGLLYLSLWGPSGIPSGFADVQVLTGGFPGGFLDVATDHGQERAADGGWKYDLHVVGNTIDGGKVWHAIRRNTDLWTTFEDIATQGAGSGIGWVSSVACAFERHRLTSQVFTESPGDMLNVLAVTRDDHRLYHTKWHWVRGGQWDPWDDVGLKAGHPSGFTDVACAYDGASLLVCAIAASKLLYARLDSAGNWTTFEEVNPGQITTNINYVGCGIPQGPTSGPGCTTAALSPLRRLAFTKRARMLLNRSPRSSGASLPLQVFVTTFDEKIWHTQLIGGQWNQYGNLANTGAGQIGGTSSVYFSVTL